jgi:hypothetical protein
VKAHTALFAKEHNDYGYAYEEDLCDVETLLVAASAMNPGCDANDDGQPGPGHPANQCFVPGGGVAEYLTHPNWTHGGIGWGGTCNGDPNDPAGNLGCAKPVATFVYTNDDTGDETTDDVNSPVDVDPRMLMIIHEAFGQ